ncbi:protein farnesyltransferase subunit beta [Ophiocordyceps camponoti-floridani]|uniref:Protein farnesyltransferase subunit beta n=1 Tax=Ophiocordyceps camponoti-floridani TaxID=2030778 RepID=A0A8H4QED0_9HYPO|nr:protein farnesyltransferase subunit beta [Ophiocordyceps camponoti-floridani]
MTTMDDSPSVPHLFASEPPIRDGLETESSRLQDETIRECLPFLTGKEHDSVNAHGVPHLYRDRHVRFLHKQLGNLPSGFTAADPSRPWIFYWSLSALTLLGQDVSSYRSRLIETVRPMQNAGGGFGGGFGQLSHLATTYATVLSLCLMGGEDAYEVINRKSLWRWLCSLKQPDGGFQMAVGGEEDVRGAYCAAVIISLLGLPLDLSPDSPARTAGHVGLLDGLGEWVQRCQTYEGGVSAKPGVEAHGAYAFCALGCLSMLGPPHQTVARYLHVPRLMSWLSARQYAPEGGFSGRTNKLVDGCYSHWVGGCWPLLAASLKASHEADERRMHENHGLFSRDGLIRYILCCGQDMSKRGGLRDKPSKHPDAYHSCYVLTGLSSVQHRWEVGGEGDGWIVAPCGPEGQIFDEEDRLRAVHPIYAIPQEVVADCKKHFASKAGF